MPLVIEVLNFVSAGMNWVRVFFTLGTRVLLRFFLHIFGMLLRGLIVGLKFFGASVLAERLRNFWDRSQERVPCQNTQFAILVVLQIAIGFTFVLAAGPDHDVVTMHMLFLPILVLLTRLAAWKL